MPKYIAIDIETKDSRGASLESYRDDFEIWSLAAAWRDEQGELCTFFCMGEDRVERFLSRVSELKTPVIVHNLTFEMGCFKARFPHLEFNWHADTMRLAQNADGGGKEFGHVLTPEQQLEFMEGKNPYYTTGLGLEACASRFLEEKDKKHKEEAHSYLAEHHGIKTKHGQHLHLLPINLLEKYNIADTKATLLLYEYFSVFFSYEGCNWRQDTAIYIERCRFIVDMYHTGTLVDRPKLAEVILKIREEVAELEQRFLITFKTECNQLRYKRYLSESAKFKSDKKKTQLRDLYDNDADAFTLNFNSNKQLQLLFVDIMGLTPKFKTEKGAPSFKAAHLPTWGPPGEMLLKRRKRLLVLKQAENLFMLSSYDGRWHANLRACGARTGRMSGQVRS